MVDFLIYLSIRCEFKTLVLLLQEAGPSEVDSVGHSQANPGGGFETFSEKTGPVWKLAKWSLKKINK